jgi:hypothetical protein
MVELCSKDMAVILWTYRMDPVWIFGWSFIHPHGELVKTKSKEDYQSECNTLMHRFDL